MSEHLPKVPALYLFGLKLRACFYNEDKQITGDCCVFKYGRTLDLESTYAEFQLGNKYHAKNVICFAYLQTNETEVEYQKLDRQLNNYKINIAVLNENETCLTIPNQICIWSTDVSRIFKNMFTEYVKPEKSKHFYSMYTDPFLLTDKSVSLSQKDIEKIHAYTHDLSKFYSESESESDSESESKLESNSESLPPTELDQEEYESNFSRAENTRKRPREYDPDLDQKENPKKMFNKIL